jgi:hypothetical protein
MCAPSQKTSKTPFLRFLELFDKTVSDISPIRIACHGHLDLCYV